MKRKWWIGIAAVITAFGASLCFYGVRVRLFPRLVLTGALNETLTQLESRYENSPLHMFESVFNSSGYYQADLQLETELDYVGPVRYDMELQTQMSPLRIAGTGTAVTGGKALDLSVYLDRDFAAVSSDGLVEGNYYGITYDTFSRDIRSYGLLAALIGEETISQWENGVSGLADAMSAELTQPEFSAKDIRTALYGVLTLKPQVSKASADWGGAPETVHVISFQASGQQITDAAQPYQKELTPQISAWIDSIRGDPDFLAKTEFSLDHGTLVKLEAHIQYSGGSGIIRAFFDRTIATEPLILEWEIREGETLRRSSLSVDTVADAESYSEDILLTQTQNGKQKSREIHYRHDLSSGEMDLQYTGEGRSAEARLHLAGEGERIRITTQNAGPILDLLREKPLKNPVICTLSISPGSPVSIPAYRNLDQWSMDDLLTLLKGLGSLIGLKLP